MKATKCSIVLYHHKCYWECLHCTDVHYRSL